MVQATEQLMQTPVKVPRGFFGHWVHSREEDRDGVEVYRPRTFDFPPAFGRDGFDIRADGTFTQFDPGPADGVVRTGGRWELTAPRTITVVFKPAERPGFTFLIAGLDGVGDAAILRIARRPGKHAGPSDDDSLRAYAALPPATSARRIDFETVEIHTLRSFPPQHVLVVSGVKPYLNMAVDLVPVVYIRQPEFWEIEVVGRLRGVGLPALAPYTATLNLAGTVGSQGVQVVGATRSERLVVPGGNGDGPATE